MKQKNFIFFIIVLLFIFSLISIAFARNYGDCLYGEDLYGGGTCEVVASSSSSSGGGGGGGGGGGSSQPTTSWFSGTSGYNVIDTDNILDAVNSVAVTATCTSSDGRCSVVGREVGDSSSIPRSDIQGNEGEDAVMSILGESITDQAAQSLSSLESGQILAQVREFVGEDGFVKVIGGYTMNCRGTLGENVATFDVDLNKLSDFSNDVGCDDIYVTTVNGGVEAGRTSGCQIQGNTLKFNTAYNGCQNYVVLFGKGGAATPATQQQDQVPGTTTEEEQPVAQSEAVKPSSLGLILVILGVIVVLVVGYLVFKKKHRAF